MTSYGQIEVLTVPVVVHVGFPIVQPARCTCYLKLFILIKRSTFFGRSFRLSSGAQNCVYINGICQTAAAAIGNEVEVTSHPR